MIVGGGPGWAFAAIRLKRIDPDQCLLDRQGCRDWRPHLSGTWLDTRPEQVIPDWRGKARRSTPVQRRPVHGAIGNGATTVLNFILPACFQNHGNYISLGALCRWLSPPTEALGVGLSWFCWRRHPL